MAANIKQLNCFFHEAQWNLDGERALQIYEMAIANPDQAGGYIKVYWIYASFYNVSHKTL